MLPWSETSSESEQIRFIERWQAGRVTLAAVAMGPIGLCGATTTSWASASAARSVSGPLYLNGSTATQNPPSWRAARLDLLV